MPLSEKDMNYLCSLAKIKPEAHLLTKYASQCDDILSYMKELDEVNTSNVEPMYSPVLHTIIYREDIENSKLTREDILKNAPNTDEEYFIVPKIVEG